MLRSVIKSTTMRRRRGRRRRRSMAGVEKARNRPQTQRNDDFDDNLEHICNCEQPAM